MNSVKEVNIKICMHYFLDQNKNLHQTKIKTDENSCKNVLIYSIGYMKTNSVKPLCLIINKINRYPEESNGHIEKAWTATEQN